MNLLQKVFVIAYDCPHRKTYDVLTLLKSFGYKNVTVFTSPMTYKKTFIPLLQHRPNTVHFIETKTLCDHLDYRCEGLKQLKDLIFFYLYQLLQRIYFPHLKFQAFHIHQPSLILLI